MVRTEASGAAALAAAVDWVPDVVVLDLGLPDIDGADVCACCGACRPCR